MEIDNKDPPNSNGMVGLDMEMKSSNAEDSNEHRAKIKRVCCGMLDVNFCQVLLLSFAFMLLFTAFNTTGLIEETVLQSLRNETSVCVQKAPSQGSQSESFEGNGTFPQEGPQIPFTTGIEEDMTRCPNGTIVPGFTGSGYTSLAIIYGVFAGASWFAPSIVALLYPKWSMILSSLIYVSFMVTFLFPRTWILYVLSGGLGLGAALIWTAQGRLLSLLSGPDTVSRNSSVFWAINQASLFFGNLLVFWALQGKTEINEETRSLIFIPLCIVAILGVLCFCLLKNIKSDQTLKNKSTSPGNNNQKGEIKAKVGGDPDMDQIPTSPLKALKDSFKLFLTAHILLLSLSSVYSGLEYSFLSGIYPTAVGNTGILAHDPKKYVGLVGIVSGLGDVSAGVIFGLLGSRTSKLGRSPIVLLGAIVHLVCYGLVFINTPNAATFAHTQDVPYLANPQPWIALVSGFLLGFGNACLQIQLIATFASVYKENSAGAFAIFKFTQSAAAALSFFSSSHLGTRDQLLLLSLSALVSLGAFCTVEWRTARKLKDGSNGSGDEPPER